MFGFNRSNAEELTAEEARKVNERFNSFKNDEYSEDDMHKVFENEDTIMGKMNNKNLRGFVEDVKIFFSMLKDFFSKVYRGSNRNNYSYGWFFVVCPFAGRCYSGLYSCRWLSG